MSALAAGSMEGPQAAKASAESDNETTIGTTRDREELGVMQAMLPRERAGDQGGRAPRTGRRRRSEVTGWPAGFRRRCARLLCLCPGTESNCLHTDFQSVALPVELPGRFSNAVRT